MTAPLGKDLVGLEDLSADQIRLILDTAEPFKEVSERPIKKVPALRGKTIVNLFFEASTRTRISFDGTTLYFFSERLGGFGKRDLYVTTRARLGGPDVAKGADGKKYRRGEKHEKGLRHAE